MHADAVAQDRAMCRGLSSETRMFGLAIFQPDPFQVSTRARALAVGVAR